MSVRSKCSMVGTMSSTASFSTRSGWSSARRCATRAPRSWLPTQEAVDGRSAPSPRPCPAPSRAWRRAHGPPSAARLERAAVAAQVGADHREALGQRRRHRVPHRVRLRVAVQQQQRRARAAVAQPDRAAGQRHLVSVNPRRTCYSPPMSLHNERMSTDDITRVPNRTLPSKSSVAVYRLPGGGGFLWAVATSPDRTPNVKIRTLGCLGVLDGYLKGSRARPYAHREGGGRRHRPRQQAGLRSSLGELDARRQGAGTLVRAIDHAGRRHDRDHHHRRAALTLPPPFLGKVRRVLRPDGGGRESPQSHGS